MATQLQLRQGTTTETNAFTGALGEVTYDTTKKCLVTHDGVTAGGNPVPYLSGGYIPNTILPSATTTATGVVQLNNTLTSASTTQALTAAQGKVLNDQAFGVGQTPQNMTASRVLGTVYTNTSGKAIFVFINFTDVGDTNCTLVLGGISSGSLDNGSISRQQISFVVPNNVTYQITTPATVTSWIEVR